jgi:hypothetical protein
MPMSLLQHVRKGELCHCGRLSRLDKDLCKILGRLMPKKPPADRSLLFFRLAKKLEHRCAAVGIRIALVGDHGQVEEVEA